MTQIFPFKNYVIKLRRLDVQVGGFVGHVAMEVSGKK